VVTPGSAGTPDGAPIGTLRLVPVKLGAYGPERVPVLSGLKRDDWVLAAGVHMVREG